MQWPPRVFHNDHLVGPSRGTRTQKKIAAAVAVALLLQLLLPLHHRLFLLLQVHGIAVVGGPAASMMFAGNFRKVRLVLRVAF